MINILKKNNFGFVALIFVIMISSIFIVSSVIIAMVNTSNNMANYHSLESDDVMYNLDACLSDAMWQIASTTDAVGNYSIAVAGVNCAYQISATNSGMKTVTSTATTTSAVGSWNRSVVMQVNVSSSPFFIQSHKDYLAGTCLNNSCCGDAVCNTTETCSSCGTDCGVCMVCGNGVQEGTEACDDGDTITETQTCGNLVVEGAVGGPYCDATCTTVITLTETCDDGAEACGDGVKQNGTFCNDTCTGTVARTEVCDYLGQTQCSAHPDAGYLLPVGCGKKPYCNKNCDGCATICQGV